jgi:hypothetical protein
MEGTEVVGIKMKASLEQERSTESSQKATVEYSKDRHSMRYSSTYNDDRAMSIRNH